MLSSNTITRFLDHQYLEETAIVLIFLLRDSNQGKIACKTTNAGWVWPCMPSRAQAGMHRLIKGEFDWSGDGLATLEVIQNEKLIEF